MIIQRKHQTMSCIVCSHLIFIKDHCNTISIGVSQLWTVPRRAETTKLTKSNSSPPKSICYILFFGRLGNVVYWTSSKQHRETTFANAAIDNYRRVTTLLLGKLSRIQNINKYSNSWWLACTVSDLEDTIFKGTWNRQKVIRLDT